MSSMLFNQESIIPKIAE